MAIKKRRIILISFLNFYKINNKLRKIIRIAQINIKKSLIFNRILQYL